MSYTTIHHQCSEPPVLSADDGADSGRVDTELVGNLPLRHCALQDSNLSDLIGGQPDAWIALASGTGSLAGPINTVVARRGPSNVRGVHADASATRMRCLHPLRTRPVDHFADHCTGDLRGSVDVDISVAVVPFAVRPVDTGRPARLGHDPQPFDGLPVRCSAAKRVTMSPPPLIVEAAPAVSEMRSLTPVNRT